jgi:hypothetical protein
MADITVATSASGDGSRPWKTDVASMVPSGVNRTVSSVTSAAPNFSKPVTEAAA